MKTPAPDSSKAQHSKQPSSGNSNPQGSNQPASGNAKAQYSTPPAQPQSPQNNSSPWVYSEIVKAHFLNPRNFLMGDESKYPHDAEGTVGNPVCGDQMKMFLQITDDKIIDVKWKTYGCASAIASTSALSELAKGKTLDDALEIGPAEIANYLGGLPAHKFHCSVLGHEALAAAIKAYRER